MNYSLFDSFKKNLYQSYTFLNDYEIKFTHCGDQDCDLTYFLEITTVNQTYSNDLEVRLGIAKKIKDFGKLFSIKILTLSDFSTSGIDTSNIYIQ